MVTKADLIAAVEATIIHPTKQAAAVALRIPVSTLKNRLEQAERAGIRVDPPPKITLPPEDLEPPPTFEKPRIRVAAGTNELRILAIGDVHAAPGMPTDHLGWIARHAIDTNPTHVVQIGDFGDWGSCSAHDPNDTLKGRLKPSFLQDEEAVHEAYEALYGPMIAADLKVSCYQTDGNHEDRCDRFVNSHPELAGDWDIRIRQLPARFRVERKNYGEWLFLGGVGFIHHPSNGLGKAFGGKYPENTIANEAVFSIVWGHSHKSNVVHRPKIGPHGTGVTILNLGTAMPPGHVPPYAQRSTTGWSYGIFDLRVTAGRITSHSFVSIDELGRRYA